MQTPISMIDMTIVVVYLLITLFVGIKSGMGKNTNKTMKDYALGNRSFTTTAMVATIVASWIGGHVTIGLVTEIYNKSWIFGLVFLGYLVGFLLTKHIFANRVQYFAGCYSVGDMINKIFGAQSQILVGVLSTIKSMGTAMGQILALGLISNYFLNIDPKIGMLIGGGVFTIYSTFGGVRAVIATDIMQFAVLVVAIPIVLGFAITKIGGYEVIFTQAPNITLQEYDIFSYIVIFLSFCIPRLYPAMIQRFLIARNIKQLYKSLDITMFIILFIIVIIILIGISTAILYPNYSTPSNIFAYLIHDLMPVGLKGFIITGLLAVIMSTADTELNTGSIAFVHDVVKKLGIKKINEAYLVPIVTFCIGIMSIIVAMQFTSIFEALLFTQLLWYPVMLCPLILGIYGLKSNDKTFISSTIITTIMIIIFHNVWSTSIALSIICGIAFNFVIFMLCHYYMHKNYKFINTVTEYIKEPRQNSITWDTSFFTSINPSYGAPYAIFGLCIIINFCFPHFIWEETIDPFYTVSTYLRFISGVSCVMLIMKDLWLPNKYFPIFWHTNVIFSLPFLTGFNLWAHNVDTFWLAMMGIMLLLMVSLVDWLRALIFTIIGMLTSFVLYKLLGGSLTTIPASNMYAIFYLVAAFMVIGSIFIKRKEDVYQSVIDEKDDLIVKQKNRLTHMNEVTNKALGVQHRILRNFSHELRTPMSSALSIADILEDRTIDDNMHTNSINVLHKSLNRFRSYIEDIMTIATGQEDNMPLTQTPTSITKLVKQAIKAFTTLDYPPKPIHIKTDVMDNVMANLDPNEIKRVLHIILDNAVRYSEDKVHITVNVQRQGNTSVRVSIADDGVGIPEEEKSTVFTPFIESKRTRLETGGKGLGLAVASNIIKAHKMGYIEARDNEPQGTEIFFDMECLPEGWKNPVKQADKTILLIDDDDSILLVHRYGMQKSGYRVLEAENGYIGMDMFEKYKDEIDIIIVDLMMPGFNGVEVINDIMNKYPEQYVKIIPFLHTGAAEGDYMREIGKLKDNKCVKILHKPIRTKDIIQAIEDRMEDCR